MTTNLQAALDLAARGFAVFPCHVPTSAGCSCGSAECGSIGKHPRTRSGVKEATTDTATLRSWWERWPEANVGLATGDASGVFVVDLDGEQGVGAFQSVAVANGGTPTTCEAETGGGGRHLFFKMPAGIAVKNRAKIGGQPVDVRGTGGYVLVAPSLHKSGRRYRWTSPPEATAEAPAWLLEWLQPRPPAPASCVSYATHSSGLRSIEERAALYLDKCEPAVSGQGGHNRTFHVAGQLVHGFALSVDVAFQLLTGWNARCSPPWSDAELRRKVEQAAAAPCDKPRGWLADDSFTFEPAALGVDFSKLDAALTSPAVVAPASGEPAAEADEAAAVDPGPFPSAVFDDLPGVLSSIVAYNLDTTDEPQKEIALAGALSLVSVVVGRRVKDHRGTRPNIFVIALAPSGAGKDHSRAINRRILTNIGAASLLGPERIGSHAGILSHLAEKDWPASLMQVDEIGDLLATMKASGAKMSHLKSIESVLKSIYSSAGSEAFVGDAYANTQHVKTICQPYLVLYGSTTPQSYWGNLSADNVENGLLARMMVAESPGYATPSMVDVVEKPIPASILEWARAWFTFTPGAGNLSAANPTPMTAVYDQDAMAAAKLHAFDVRVKRQSEDVRTAATWSRAPEKAAKLAMLFACARVVDPAAGVRVTLADVERAKLVANWLTRRMVFQTMRCVFDNAEEGRKKTLLKLIPEWPETVSLTTLGRKTQGMKRAERQAAIDDLVASRLVSYELVGEGNKKAAVLWRGRRPAAA